MRQSRAGLPHERGWGLVQAWLESRCGKRGQSAAPMGAGLVTSGGGASAWGALKLSRVEPLPRRGVSAPFFPTPRRCWGPSSADPYLLRASDRLPSFLRILAHLCGGRKPPSAFPRGMGRRLPALCLLLGQLSIPLALGRGFLRWSVVRRVERL